MEIGVASRANVEQVFGKPSWEGPAEKEPVDEDGPDAILLEYKEVGGFTGGTTLVLDAQTGKVKAISLYPQKPLPLEKLIRQYGERYIERESALGPCPTVEELRAFRPPEEREYPIFLVYPQRGMYLSVEKNKVVSQISYLDKCGDY